MDQTTNCVTCKGCGRKLQCILKHIAQSMNCKNSYTEEELSSLKIESKRKRKERQRFTYDSAKRAVRYQNNKERVANQYDPVKRAEKYKSDKENNKSVFNI